VGAAQDIPADAAYGIRGDAAQYAAAGAAQRIRGGAVQRIRAGAAQAFAGVRFSAFARVRLSALPRMRQDGVMKQPRDFSLHGAIDLGARQAAVQRRQRAAEQSSATRGEAGDQAGTIIEVTDETFNSEVVARSRSVPVILDLWAEWCGPCKQLGPILEKLAVEADGAWVLAKIDVDANPQLSAALQVQSIPMVVAVVAGQIADGFLGAMPESQVREWLGQVMRVAVSLGLQPPAGNGNGQDDGEAAQTGQPGGAGMPGQPGAAGMPGQRGVMPGYPDDAAADPYADSAFTAAQAAMERGDLNAAGAEFEKVLAEYPGDPVATMGLRQVDLIRRVESYDQATALREADELPGDAHAQARAADIDMAMGKIGASFDRLLDTIRRTSGDERDLARQHLVGLFEIFPPKDPRVAKARATLSSLLF
jgi:putative thioredoxin